MSDLICRKTMTRCQTPGMCAPHGGCQSQHDRDSSELRRLCAERAQLHAANQRLEGEVARLRKALTHIIECDWQSRQDATDSTISELKGGVIRNMRGLAHDALSTNGEVTG